MAGQLMRSHRAQFFHEHAFCKEPGTQRATPWHQDLPYYCVEGTKTVSLYVSLDEVPAEVAVRFVRGSHRWGRLFYPRVFLDGADFNTDDDAMEAIPDIDAHPEDYEILAWDLAPGDVIAFDFRTLHGTTAGRVEGRRRALSTRWLGDDVTYCRRPGETSPPFPTSGSKKGNACGRTGFRSFGGTFQDPAATRSESAGDSAAAIDLPVMSNPQDEHPQDLILDVRHDAPVGRLGIATARLARGRYGGLSAGLRDCADRPSLRGVRAETA